MSDLYHIYIKPKAGLTREKVEETLNLAVHWFRYRDQCYVVQTTSDEDKWQVRLLPLVEPDGALFICKLDPSHYNGVIRKDFWEWFQPRIKKP